MNDALRSCGVDGAYPVTLLPGSRLLTIGIISCSLSSPVRLRRAYEPSKGSPNRSTLAKKSAERSSSDTNLMKVMYRQTRTFSSSGGVHAKLLWYMAVKSLAGRSRRRNVRGMGHYVTVLSGGAITLEV